VCWERTRGGGTKDIEMNLHNVRRGQYGGFKKHKVGIKRMTRPERMRVSKQQGTSVLGQDAVGWGGGIVE